MQVILLENVRNLGNVGDLVKVKNGYGRNFLVPQGKAVFATPANIEEFEEKRAEYEKVANELMAEAQGRADKVAALTIVITARAGDEGKLFGSIGTREIADAVVAAGVEVQKSEVCLPEGVLREIGEYPIEIQLHSDVIAKINVTIEAE